MQEEEDLVSDISSAAQGGSRVSRAPQAKTSFKAGTPKSGVHRRQMTSFGYCSNVRKSLSLLFPLRIALLHVYSSLDAAEHLAAMPTLFKSACRRGSILSESRLLSLLHVHIKQWKSG